MCAHESLHNELIYSIQFNIATFAVHSMNAKITQDTKRVVSNNEVHSRAGRKTGTLVKRSRLIVGRKDVVYREVTNSVFPLSHTKMQRTKANQSVHEGPNKQMRSTQQILVEVHASQPGTNTQ